jgi:probable F420-dependent oxidoreductase
MRSTGTSSPSGRLGLWAGFLGRLPSSEAIESVRALEEAGVDTIWLQEFGGPDPFIRAARYLTATARLRVALGVAVIYARDPEATVAAASTLEESFPGRFVLGLGVSHRQLVESRGHRFGPPVPTMASYLRAMSDTQGDRLLPPVVLGALGPRMLELAGAATDGAHTYLPPVSHTAHARAALGPDRWLAPSQLVAVRPAHGAWRDEVRPFLRFCLDMPNYASNLRRHGFSADDIDSISDRLVDAVVVPDDADLLHQRIDDHRSAGADHVVLQFVPQPAARTIPERLAAVLPQGRSGPSGLR